MSDIEPGLERVELPEGFIEQRQKDVHGHVEKLMREAEPPAVPYGIIDPDYARVFTIARCLAWQEGYAIAMHGSFTRDLDLIAVPWAERICEPEHLIRRIASATGLEIHVGPGIKLHGRLAWTLMFPAFGDPRFVDISVIPAAAPAASN